METSEFMGVFYFTNWTDEDFVHLWNNEEYTFPKQSMVPMIMAKEPAENIQEIRKRFAYDLAVREFYKSPQYKKMSKMGNGIPPTFDEKILEPMIEKCLIPLPKAKAVVRQKHVNQEKDYKSSAAIGDNQTPAAVFDVPERKNTAPVLGKMPDRII
jgi:hypothetical protein